MSLGDSSSPALHHCAKTTLSEDGVVTLQGTPFLRGESVEGVVEVIIVPFNARSSFWDEGR
jgi:hypothetical protein